MPKRTPVRLDGWKDGLMNMTLSPDTRAFIDAVYDMPLDFVVAFENDRDRIASALLKDGIVKGEETAQAYATELLGRMVWMKSIRPMVNEKLTVIRVASRPCLPKAPGRVNQGDAEMASG